MSSSMNKGDISLDEKRQKISVMYKHHKSFLDKHEVQERNFIPKLFYQDKGELVVAMFPSEISREQDLYIENASISYDPLDEKRTLYKYAYNPHYKDEYRQTDIVGSLQQPRYLVPVAELTIVSQSTEPVATLRTKEVMVAVKEEKPTTAAREEKPVKPEDCLMSEITVRDHLAMKYNKPISTKKWLNDLIEKNR